MDLVDKSLAELEWPQLLAHYAALCQSEPGKQEALKILPADAQESAETLLEETDEGLRLLKESSWTWLGSLSDLTPTLERVRLGSVLSGSEIREVTRLIHMAAESREAFFSAAPASAAASFASDSHESLPHFAALITALEDLGHLLKSIDRALDETGHVKDNASPALSSLRSEERRLHAETRDKLEAMVQDAFREGWLRDKIWDFRDGRYLVPVRSDARSKVPGTAVESSSSKATVFVEPAAIRAHNDRIRQVQVDIEEEVYRILRALSETVHPHHASLGVSFRNLLAADMILARARLSLELASMRGSSRPRFGDEVSLEGLWHPLLGWVMDPGKIVRNALVFGRNGRVLIVSGPNTGGKTVLLKSLGLAALMARAGFHLACAGEARLPFFRKVLSLIGDAQNLELSLSSFSGSVAALNEILRAAEANTLVVVDEILHATDPDEASALSRSILLDLAERGTFAMITTHLNGLKVAEPERFQSASMEFDAEELCPTYRLRIGIPGRSHAMEIAARLGMPRPVVDRARSFVSESHFRYEEALRAVENKERELDDSRAEVSAAEAACRLREGELRRRETEMDAAKRSWKKKYEDEFSQRERAALQKIDALAEELKKEVSDVAARHEISRSGRRIVQAAREELRSVQTVMDAAIPAAPSQDETPGGTAAGGLSALRQGGKVWIKPMKTTGVLQSDPANQDRPALVLVGSMKMRMEWNHLRPAEDAHAPTGGSRRAPSAMTEASVPEELNLIGRTTADAETELSLFLDRASRSGRAYVRIVHGHGTGALKRAVREYLKRCGYELNYRPGSAGEGGDGCTVVEFL